MKKLLAASLTLVMLVGAMAGCSKPADTAGTPTPTPTPTQAADNVTPEVVADTPAEYNGVDVLTVSQEPMDVTLHYAYYANGAVTGDMAIWQKAKEYTNVGMINTSNPSIVDEAESFNTMLLDDVHPDIICAQTYIMQPVAQDLFIPLDDLIDLYAPNIKKYLDMVPEAKVGSTHADGNKYMIMGSLSGSPGQLLPSMGFFIRQDWLDALDLPVPTTLEELKTTLYAFRNDDPNGNNIKDEVPLFDRQINCFGILQLFGVEGNWGGQWFVDKDGKVGYGKTTDEYKAAMKELAQWYKDGIIDQELFTRGSQARQELLGNNVGGFTMDWFQSTGGMNFNADILAQVPDINFVSILPPADINGVVKQIYSRAPISGYGWGISQDCKDPVAAIKYMDFWFTEEASMLINYGVEGISYTMENGVPTYTAEAMSHPAGLPNYMRTIGVGEFPAAPKNISTEVDSMDEIARAGFEMYFDSGSLTAPFPTLSLTEEEQAMADNINPNLDYGTWEQQALLGTIDVDATWDAHIAELRSNGFYELQEIMQAAYDRYVAIINN